MSIFGIVFCFLTILKNFKNLRNKDNQEDFFNFPSILLNWIIFGKISKIKLYLHIVS